MAFKLRDYQQKAVDEAIRQFDEGIGSVLMSMAVGGGKTVCAANVAEHFLRTTNKRVMAIAHRQKLISQAADKWEKATGLRPGIEMNVASIDERSEERPRVVIASIQTLNTIIGKVDGRKIYRFEKFNPAEFAFVWVDECQHCVSTSWQRVIAYFEDKTSGQDTPSNSNPVQD